MPWSAQPTRDTNPWYQLSTYTLAQENADIDFMQYADEQFPILVYEDGRAQRIVESGYSGAP